MIFDSDVLIWFLRGNAKAASAIEAVELRRVSVVTLMELHQGARDKREQKAIGRLLRDLAFEILPISEKISHRAGIYVEEYCLQGNLRLADALIAATSVEYRDTLCSANAKHYKVVAELDLQVLRPE